MAHATQSSLLPVALIGKSEVPGFLEPDVSTASAETTKQLRNSAAEWNDEVALWHS